MTVVICGSRTWRDEEAIRAVLAQLPPGTHIVTGGARGADAIAAAVARALGLHVTEVPADWARHGRAAGPVRNRQMVEEYRPQLCIAFRRAHGPSPGTDHMVRLCRQRGIPVQLIQGE